MFDAYEDPDIIDIFLAIDNPLNLYPPFIAIMLCSMTFLMLVLHTRLIINNFSTLEITEL